MRKTNGKTTTERYLDFLTHLSKRERGFRGLNPILQKHRLSVGLGKVLKSKNLIENNNGVWKWTGGSPSLVTAQNILNTVNSNIRESASATKNSKPKVQRTHTIGSVTTEATPSNFRTLMNLKRNGNGNNHSNNTSTQETIKKYVPQGTDVLNLSELRAKKADLKAQIDKIDSLLEFVDAFKNGN